MTDETKGQAVMTPQEKWERLTKPRELADYHLTLSAEELEQFPVGREILGEVHRLQAEEENR